MAWKSALAWKNDQRRQNEEAEEFDPERDLKRRIRRTPRELKELVQESTASTEDVFRRYGVDVDIIKFLREKYSEEMKEREVCLKKGKALLICTNNKAMSSTVKCYLLFAKGEANDKERAERVRNWTPMDYYQG